MPIVGLLLFSLVCTIVIYPLGKFVINILKLEISFWEDFLISINVGIVIFTSLIFFLWLANLYKFTYFIVLPTAGYLIFLLVRLKNYKKKYLKQLIQIDPIFLVIIFICIIVQSLITFQSGDVMQTGLRLIGANGQDGLSYLALINSLQKSVPPENPSFSGEILKNYHYFTYIFISATIFLTKIENLTIVFKIIMPFFTLLFSSTSFLLIKKMTGSKVIGYFGTLLLCLSSNFYYLAGFLYPRANITPSVFWVDEYLTRMVNPQLITSYIILLTLFYLLITYKKIQDLRFIIIFSFLTGSLVSFKAFGSIILLCSLALVALYKIFRKDVAYLKIFIGSIIFSLIFYLFSNPKSDSIILFSPLWFIKNMFETSDHLNYSEWELKRQTYLVQHNYFRIIQLYIEGLAVFLVGNLGGRLIGLLSFGQIGNKPSKEILIFVGLMSFFATVFPLTFLVRGTAWNSIQFFYYAVLAFGILTIIFINEIYLKKKAIGILFFIILLISLLPGVYDISYKYIFNNRNDFIGSGLFEACQFLSQQKDGVVLIHPKYYSNSFVSAISKKTSFFADEKWLMVQLVPFETRKNQVQKFFSKDPTSFSKKFLEDNYIKYILTQAGNDIGELKIKKIYTNSEIAIYQVI